MFEPDLCASLQECQKLKTVRRAGAWRLAPRCAMSLLPRKNSQLLIVQGSAWITWDQAMDHGAQTGGDHFLVAGQIIDVPAGVRVVMQARHAHEALHFDWREMPPGCASYRPSRVSMAELVRQWLQAWVQLGRATARLVPGMLGGLGWWLARPHDAKSGDLPV